MGHALKSATHASQWSMGANISTATHEMCDMIEFLVDALKPRVIAMDRDVPSIIYTDGAFEAREGAWGAIVTDSATGVEKFAMVGYQPPCLNFG